MTEAAAQYGYAGATVARACERAGISRATFYEHFADRDACFEAAYAEVEEATLSTLARGEGHPATERARWLLTAFLAGAEADPAAARLLLIESRGGAAALRRRRAALQRSIEAAIERCLTTLPAEGGNRLRVPPLALVGGVENVIAVRLQRGEAGRICFQLFDLLAWIDSYALPAGAPAGAEPDWACLGRALGPPSPAPRPAARRRLPRGRAALPAAEAASERRERILAAVARLSRERGYGAMSVADIVAAASVSRASFYEAFRGKQDAFLAAQTIALQHSISLAAEAFFGAETWPERVWAGIEATFSYIASQPDLATLDTLESFAAGPAAIGRSFENRMAFGLFLAEGYAQRPQARALPQLCSEAVGGALLELLRTYVIAGRTESVLEVLPAAVYVALAPFVGATEALAYVEAKVEERAGRLVLPAGRWLSSAG